MKLLKRPQQSETVEMPRVTRPQMPLQDLDEEQWIPPKAPLILPKDDMVKGMQELVEQFGKKSLPNDIPDTLKTMVNALLGMTEMSLKASLEQVQETEYLIDDLLKRFRDHEAYMTRQRLLASKVKDKLKNLHDEINKEVDAELAKEEGGQ